MSPYPARGESIIMYEINRHELDFEFRKSFNVAKVKHSSILSAYAMVDKLPQMTSFGSFNLMS
jgi:hypothetical protein